MGPGLALLRCGLMGCAVGHFSGVTSGISVGASTTDVVAICILSAERGWAVQLLLYTVSGVGRWERPSVLGWSSRAWHSGGISHCPVVVVGDEELFGVVWMGMRLAAGRGWGLEEYVTGLLVLGNGRDVGCQKWLWGLEGHFRWGKGCERS